MSDRLYRVGVKYHAALTAYPSDLGDREDRTYLVVCVHRGDEAGVVSYRVGYLLRTNIPVFVYGEQFNLKSLRLEPVQRVQNGVMLKGGGDYVPLALFGTDRGGGEYRLIVRFASAGGKHDLTSRGSDAFRDPCTCFL